MKVVIIIDPDRYFGLAEMTKVADAELVLVHESDSREVEILKSRDNIDLEVIG